MMSAFFDFEHALNRLFNKKNLTSKSPTLLGLMDTVFVLEQHLQS